MPTNLAVQLTTFSHLMKNFVPEASIKLVILPLDVSARFPVLPLATSAPGLDSQNSLP